jgi:hypothetical protein
MKRGARQVVPEKTSKVMSLLGELRDDYQIAVICNAVSEAGSLRRNAYIRQIGIDLSF